MKAGVAVIKTVDIRKNDKSLSAAENGYDRRKHIVVAEKSVFGKEIVTKVDSRNPDIPPMAVIEGIDLVTEGVLTLGKCIKLLKKYVRDEFDAEFFDELDAENGASKLAKLLIEECTELNLFVGTAVNDAHRESELNFDLSMRQNLVEQLVSTAEKMGRRVKVKYY